MISLLLFSLEDGFVVNFIDFGLHDKMICCCKVARFVSES